MGLNLLLQDERVILGIALSTSGSLMSMSARALQTMRRWGDPAQEAGRRSINSHHHSANSDPSR